MSRRCLKHQVPQELQWGQGLHGFGKRSVETKISRYEQERFIERRHEDWIGRIAVIHEKSPQKEKPMPSKKEKEPAVHCNFVIDKSIHTRMKYLAIEKNMSLRDIVNEAMKEYLAKHEK